MLCLRVPTEEDGMTAREILERALDRYESGRYRWCKGAIHQKRKVKGVPVEYVCLLGSLADDPTAGEMAPFDPSARDLLMRSIQEHDEWDYSFASVPDFNDAT